MNCWKLLRLVKVNQESKKVFLKEVVSSGEVHLIHRAVGSKRWRKFHHGLRGQKMLHAIKYSWSHPDSMSTANDSKVVLLSTGHDTHPPWAWRGRWSTMAGGRSPCWPRWRPPPRWRQSQAPRWGWSCWTPRRTSLSRCSTGTPLSSWCTVSCPVGRILIVEFYLCFWPQVTTCTGVKQKHQRYSWIIPGPGIVELYLDSKFHPECFIKSYTCKLARAIVHLQVSIGWWVMNHFKI